MTQTTFLPSNGTVTAVTYDFRKRRLFYADVRSGNSRIAVIFPGNGIRREIYLSGKHKKLFPKSKNLSLILLSYENQPMDFESKSID